ncbi:ImmA/IrrE family metallo-endopeptidase [Thermicanus aegyptius]|uniref:ImmA/IrrE family metallo-endopeptidase n=1 Tax=Thermicanus aegyptius TaxID=94009 RepID=UPI0004090E95|nr:ImmA/IrrE family metallo-endopeptidase [Thermicanus aegyptius]
MSKWNEWAEICKKKALETRIEYGISPYSPIEVFKLLKEADINVIKEPIDSHISGFFLKRGHSELVFINTKRSIGHQNFTAAHEYYHIKFDVDISGRVCFVGRFDVREPNEFKADLFASYLLAPDEAINFHLYRRGIQRLDDSTITLKDVIDLEQIFGISHTAMLVRLQQMGLSSEKAAVFKPNVIKNARSLGYNVSLYQESNDYAVISKYAEKAKIAFDKGLISSGKYEELLLEAGLIDILYSENEHEEGDLI